MFGDTANSQDLVNVKEVRDNTIVVKGGGLRQVIMVGGTNFALKSEEEQNVITQLYQNFLNSLDFPVQIIVHSRKINIDKYLEKLEDRKVQEPSGLLQNQISEYQDFIRNFVKDYAIMKKLFLVVVSYAPASFIPGAATVSRMLPFRKKQTPEGATAQSEADFKESVSQLRQRTDSVADGIRAVGLEATILNDDQLVELFYNFYNPESIEKEKLTLPPQEPTTPSDVRKS
jgi:type IV secretory pathway VirB4 component